MTVQQRPAALVILDGFGLADPSPGNAVALADTPVFDRYSQAGPFTSLSASGRDVGLPEGQIGNSEVGHLNIGAGRVVLQSLTFIDEEIRSGRFFTNDVLVEAARAAGGGTLHLLGLTSDGGVHASLDHLLALISLAGRLGVEDTVIHVFTDGRDTAPDSSSAALREVEAACAAAPGRVRIGSVCGRYFAMDRDHRWERTRKAFDLLVAGRAPWSARSAQEAVQAARDRGETDEFIEPTVITGPDGEPAGRIKDGDSVIF
ncbi:MAG TPA: 2,3-bisphosphoglycerate-independent phosphoglycerate mutase, partial [Deinococcales bacterium]|nr:2,3-bisphosphoglycerate-independent phosphoglycerate mutase [Deinococcales bacterium]